MNTYKINIKGKEYIFSENSSDDIYDYIISEIDNLHYSSFNLVDEFISIRFSHEKHHLSIDFLIHYDMIIHQHLKDSVLICFGEGSSKQLLGGIKVLILLEKITLNLYPQHLNILELIDFYPYKDQLSQKIKDLYPDLSTGLDWGLI